MVARHETVYYIGRMIAVKRSSFSTSNFAIDIDITTRTSTHSRLTYFDKKVCPTIFFFFFFLLYLGE